MSKKRITLLVILSCMILCIILVTVFGINVGIAGANIYSISGLMSAKTDYDKKNSEIKAQVDKYNQSKKELSASQNEYDSTKTKYNNIDTDTIQLVKNAEKVENYWIEYLWVRIDNYAKKYKLSIVMEQKGDTAAKTEATTTPATTGATTGATTPGTTVAPTTPSTTTPATTAPATTTNQPTSSAGTTTGETTTEINEKAILITVTGNYINLTNFIYAIENDDTLRFKLDNIQMIPGQSDNVKMVFTVNNLNVLK